MSAASVSDMIGSIESMEVNPPSHPTYDLKGLIRLALEEDAGDRGLFRFVLRFPSSHFNRSVDFVYCTAPLSTTIQRAHDLNIFKR